MVLNAIPVGVEAHGGDSGPVAGRAAPAGAMGLARRSIELLAGRQDVVTVLYQRKKSLAQRRASASVAKPLAGSSSAKRGSLSAPRIACRSGSFSACAGFGRSARPAGTAAIAGCLPTLTTPPIDSRQAAGGRKARTRLAGRLLRCGPSTAGDRPGGSFVRGPVEDPRGLF